MSDGSNDQAITIKVIKAIDRAAGEREEKGTEEKEGCARDDLSGELKLKLVLAMLMKGVCVCMPCPK